MYVSRQNNHQMNIIRFPPVANVADDTRLRSKIRTQIKPFSPADEPDVPQAVRVIDFQFNTLSEQQKRAHCAIMLDMLERLAECWCKSNYVTQDMLYALFEINSWTCPATGHKHSTHKPLTIEFIIDPLRGGKLEIANIRPRYRFGWYAGYFDWTASRRWFETDEAMIA
jgi:hypothetical protein